MIFPEQSESNVAVATDALKACLGETTQVMEAVTLPEEDGQGSAVPDLSNITESDAKISVLKDMSFKKF